jgi:hypothetical protein
MLRSGLARDETREKETTMTFARGTSVPVARSKAELDTMLSRRGAAPRVITTGVRVAAGVGGRRGRALHEPIPLRVKLSEPLNESAHPRGIDPADAHVVHPSRTRAKYAPLGYRERRRLAKLRRRARDRDVFRLAFEMRRFFREEHDEDHEYCYAACGHPLSNAEVRLRVECNAKWYEIGSGDGQWADRLWWTTTDGRRRWLEEDRQQKRERRALEGGRPSLLLGP